MKHIPKIGHEIWQKRFIIGCCGIPKYRYLSLYRYRIFRYIDIPKNPKWNRYFRFLALFIVFFLFLWEVKCTDVVQMTVALSRLRDRTRYCRSTVSACFMSHHSEERYLNCHTIATVHTNSAIERINTSSSVKLLLRGRFFFNMSSVVWSHFKKGKGNPECFHCGKTVKNRGGNTLNLMAHLLTVCILLHAIFTSFIVMHFARCLFTLFVFG